MPSSVARVPVMPYSFKILVRYEKVFDVMRGGKRAGKKNILQFSDAVVYAGDIYLSAEIEGSVPAKKGVRKVCYSILEGNESGLVRSLGTVDKGET